MRNIKERKSFILYFVSILVLCFSLRGAAQEVEVCANCSIKTIKQAVEKADSTATIIVKKGIYKEHDIIIDKPLILKAEPGAVIDGESKGEIISIAADNVTVDGFKIINVGSSRLKDFAAVRAKRVEGFVIQNLEIEKPFFAIFAEKSSDGKILNNKVYGNAVSEFNAGNGVHVWYSKRLEIRGNETYQMRDGIYLEFSDDIIIDNNISKDNVRYGLHFMFSQNNTVSHNIFNHNGAGIAIMFSKHMKMHHNTFKDNWGATAYGVLLKEATDCDLTYNVFDRNTTGINVEGSNRINYKHNDFKSNGWAIRSRGANYQNIFTKNNFINNSFDLAYKGGFNQNSFDGNYWSEYTGYDLDKDGIGDVPYRPVKLFSYLVNKSPESIILLRSMFIDIIDFAEKISPVLTPDNLLDNAPQIKLIDHDRD